MTGSSIFVRYVQYQVHYTTKTTGFKDPAEHNSVERLFPDVAPTIRKQSSASARPGKDVLIQTVSASFTGVKTA